MDLLTHLERLLAVHDDTEARRDIGAIIHTLRDMRTDHAVTVHRHVRGKYGPETHAPCGLEVISFHEGLDPDHSDQREVRRNAMETVTCPACIALSRPVLGLAPNRWD